MEQKKNKKYVHRNSNKARQQVNRVKETPKKEEKGMNNSTKYLCLLLVIVVFVGAFVLLINKQNDYMNDIAEGGFNVKPEVGKVIVARDMNAIYPKYYVVYTNEDDYSIYVYNYYETVSQYELEYNRLINDIVDYNEKDKMIRYIYDRGYGTYNEVLNNLSMIVNCNNLRIY